MATAANIFLTENAKNVTNDERHSPLCVIQNAGQLVAELDAIRDTIRNGWNDINPEFVAELFDYFHDEFESILDTAKSEAEEMAEKAAKYDEQDGDYDEIKEKLDCAENALRDLSSVLSDAASDADSAYQAI